MTNAIRKGAHVAQPPRQEWIFQNKEQTNDYGYWLRKRLGLLFPYISKKRSADLFNMTICATEIINNAIKNEDQFPVRVVLERRGYSLFCSVSEAKPFENPPKELHDVMAEHGRGSFIVDQLTGGKLVYDGKNGLSYFEYHLLPSRKGRVAELARKAPLAEEAATS